jgi:hypothetical protein
MGNPQEGRGFALGLVELPAGNESVLAIEEEVVPGLIHAIPEELRFGLDVPRLGPTGRLIRGGGVSGKR